MSTFIENGQVFVDGKLVKANLVISDGKIHEITDERVTCERYFDASGKVILPGMIDSHVHFREPGLTHKEDFLTGSMAAAAGGVTTVIDMPNTLPPTISVALLEEKRELAKKSVVNYGFHFGSTVDNLEEIRRARNIASVKVYMNESTGSLAIADGQALRRIFANARRVSVHAEGEKAFEAIDIIKETKNKLYLCHLTTASEIGYLKKYLKGKVFAEVSPHHLFLTSENEKDGFTKMKPELKTKADQEALWRAVDQGLIDTVGSDHAPHTTGEKRQDKPPYGVPGVETTLPLLLNAVNEKRISLKRVVELCCENPARIFGILGKGFIKPGFDADLVVVDMGLTKEVKNEELFTKCKWSPFNGWKLMGWPAMTFVNGNVVFDGKINDIKAREISLG
jgi:dihydroorotase